MSRCLPAGTEKRKETLQLIDTQLKDLDSDIRITINNIADHAHSAQDVAAALEQYASESRHGRKEAVARIWANMFELATEGFFHWWGEGLPPARKTAVVNAIDQYARAQGIVLRKIEIENPRFLKYIYGALAKVHAADEASGREENGQYLQALAALVQSAIAIAPENAEFAQFPAFLAAKNIEIWADNAHAVWVVLDANKQAAIQGADLKTIVGQSKWLHHLMKEKQALKARRQQLAQSGG